ncbi:hypothetical protein K8R33_01870 [archaeon]|nr:hypothetical protein [archaeon]
MVNLKLVDYVKRHLQKGYKEQEIKKILIKNKWDKEEINEVFKFISSKKKIASSQTKPNRLNTQQKKDPSVTLIPFIAKARKRGVSEEEIRTALITKKWPTNLVDNAMASGKPAKVKEKKEFKPKQPREPFNFKLLLWYVLAFIVAATIIAGTVFVYYYVVGLSQYTVVSNGEELTGKCIELDCSDMKDFAFDYAKENLTIMLIIGGIASLLIVLLYALLPVRNGILWGVNILYFLFLIFIGVRWILFNRSIV